QVARDANRGTAEPPHPRERFLRLRPPTPISDRDARARLREHQRRRAPNSPPPPCNEGTLAGEVDHRPHPSAECGMWSAEWQGRVVRRATLPFTFRIPHSAFRIYWARRSSTISQIRCSMARWISWIRAVSSDGTISTTSVRSLSRPPECPRKPTTVTAWAFAACAPRITLGLSPLVEWTDSTSPARARASTWRANTSSNPISLAHAVSRELSVVSATARRAGRVDW